MDPQQYESGMKYVVEDEVAAYVPCCIGPRGVLGEQMPNVASLENK